MKHLLGILGSLGLATGGSSVGIISAISTNSQVTKSELSSVYAGIITANVGVEKRAQDASMGGIDQDSGFAEDNFEWSQLQIDKTIISKMDYTKSWLKLDIIYKYYDNAGKGRGNNFPVTEDVIVTRSSFDTGKKEYNDERHHSGGKRHADHQWKWQVKVNQEGIYLWDWVWVWANGNWGNKADSKASIKINSFEYHFEFNI